MHHLLLLVSLVAQNRSADYLALARSQIVTNQLENAAQTLTVALGRAAYTLDTVNVYVWRGALDYQRGFIGQARMNFRRALRLHADPEIIGLDSLSPELATLFDSEYRGNRIFLSCDVDEPARIRWGPAFVYPEDLRPHRVVGRALLRVVVDTLGQISARSIEFLEPPDSGFIAPLTEMLTASQFYPARIKGRLVQSFLAYQFEFTPAGLTAQRE